MKEQRSVIIKKVQVSLKGVTKGVNCHICNKFLVHKRNLYRHLKDPCKIHFTAVKVAGQRNVEKPVIRRAAKPLGR